MFNTDHQKLIPLYSAVSTALLLLFFMFLKGFAPFGNLSFACFDADIQYLYFFGYLKDCLEGRNSLEFAFNKVIGGGGIALFSYYLASPFNLLVLFFDKSNFPLFFNIVVILKLSVASSCFAYFCIKRFTATNNEEIVNYLTFLLSLGYGLSNYCLTQASNIMWLDGVYLLPLILLGLFRVLRNESIAYLTIPIALSVFFNWYTAAINCCFLVIWYCIEFTLLPQSELWYVNCSNFIKKGLLSAYSVVLGIGLSAFLFYPTVEALRSSVKGNLSLELLLNSNFSGTLPNLLVGLSHAAISSTGKPALFCGTLVIALLVYAFLLKTITTKEKIIFLFILLLVALMFICDPLSSYFSLLKPMESYWFRYAYIGIFSQLFIAAFVINRIHDLQELKPYIPSFTLVAFCVFAQHVSPWVKPFNTYLWSFFLLLFVYLLKQVCTIRDRKLWSMMLFFFVFLDLSLGLRYQMKNFSINNVNEFSEYVSITERTIKEIEKVDGSVYRISQDKPRIYGQDGLTAYYSEPFLFNYLGITGYTSTPDDIVANFLERMGYQRMGGTVMNITNHPIISTDTLLGVKYWMSSYQYAGFGDRVKIPKNTRDVYQNPFAIPLAFKVPFHLKRAHWDGNPFEYQNQVFSALTGEVDRIFEAVPFNKVKKDNLITYEIEFHNGNYAYYANFLAPTWLNSELYVNDQFVTRYWAWLAPSVIALNNYNSKSTIKVEIKSSNFVPISGGIQEQFYRLNLELLAKYANKLKNNDVKLTLKKDTGAFVIEADGHIGEKILITIPYIDGWNVICNGKKIYPERYESTFFLIPLEEGVNSIEFTYTQPKKNMGMIVSLVCMILFSIGWSARRRNKLCRYISKIVGKVNDRSTKNNS